MLVNGSYGYLVNVRNLFSQASVSSALRDIWLRTNGANANGVAAKVLLLDGFGERTQNVRKFDGF